MKINFNEITLDLKQLTALIGLIEKNMDFINSLTDGTYTNFCHALGIPQNIVGCYSFEVKKTGDSVTLIKAMTY